ncbi:MAG: methionyl-tRNA formyltransferase [Alphaproteobacteria bacterium]|nr:methionyl-tRNA formyltransferase [Alphaproteobacteria bacterium]
MKIVFMGTPDFAVPTLKALCEKHEVVCVYCQAPKEAGRGQKVIKSPVQIFAESKGIEVRTPKSLRSIEEQEKFAALGADISIVAAYGLILPKAVIEAFPKGCLNVHGSLLPRWRGAAPIQRAIEAGDDKTGITIMQVVEALDAGAMYKKGEIIIDKNTTGGSLHNDMAELGAKLIIEVLDELENIKPEVQDEALVTYAAKLDKKEAKLDFLMSAEVLERKIRAFNPYPGCYFEYNGERFKILRAEVLKENGNAGHVLDMDGLCIACGQGALRVVEIQRQGKKAMPIEELLRGFRFEKGCCL